MKSYDYDNGEEMWMWPISSSDMAWKSMFEDVMVPSSNECGGDCKGAVKRRRNRKRYVVSVFPRIMKRDIRRFLPQMFINAVNECDYALLRGFFLTYSLPNLRFFDYRLTSDGSLKLEDFIPGMSDIDCLQLMIACNYELTPDASMSLLSANIRQYREDGEDHCEIVCLLHGKGLRLFELDQSYTRDVARESIANCNQYDHLMKRIPGVHKVPREEPLPIFEVGELILSLDAENRITQMQFVEKEAMMTDCWVPCTACYDAILRADVSGC